MITFYGLGCSQQHSTLNVASLWVVYPLSCHHMRLCDPDTLLLENRLDRLDVDIPAGAAVFD